MDHDPCILEHLCLYREQLASLRPSTAAIRSWHAKMNNPCCVSSRSWNKSRPYSSTTAGTHAMTRSRRIRRGLQLKRYSKSSEHSLVFAVTFVSHLTHITVAHLAVTRRPPLHDPSLHRPWTLDQQNLQAHSALRIEGQKPKTLLDHLHRRRLACSGKSEITRSLLG